MKLTIKDIEKIMPSPKKRSDKVMYYDYQEIQNFIHQLKLLIVVCR